MRETATSLFGFVLVGAVPPFVSPAHADAVDLAGGGTTGRFQEPR